MKNLFQTGTTYYLKFDTQKSFFLDTDVEHDERFSLIFNNSNVRYRIDGGTWTSLQTGYYLQIAKNNNGIADIKQVQGFLTYDQHAFNTINTIEIYGTLTSMSTLDYDVLSVKYLQLCAIENPEVFNLYQLNCDDKVVGKGATGLLTAYDNVYGKLREETNILNPSILFEYDVYPEFNYVYIPKFKRYYFVTNIVCVRNNIYRVELKVDVLYSYETDLRTQSAFVLRQENTYDASIFDDRLPTKTNMKWEYIDVNVTYPTGSNNCKNVTFDQTLSTGYRWVVSALTKNTPKAESHGVTAPANSNLTNITSVYPANVSIGSKMLYYALDLSAGCYFSNAIMKDSALASYVLSFVYYPFDVTLITQKSSPGTYSYVVVNDKTLTDYLDGTFETSPSQGQDITSAYDITNMGFAIVADFLIPTTTNYKNFEPFCYYELWVPFVGWVKLNPKDIIGKRIIVYYAIDIGSGMATAYIKQHDADSPLFSASCQVGSRLPITTTNEEQLTRQKQNNVLNLAVGLLGSGVSTAIGLATENPVAIVGGVLSATKSVASYVNANNMMFETAQTSLFSSETSLYGNISKVILRKRYYESVANFDLTTYKKLQGFPAKTYMSLSTLTGYTEIPELHYTPSSQDFITKSEIDEIVSLARSGIIL